MTTIEATSMCEEAEIMINEDGDEPALSSSMSASPPADVEVSASAPASSGSFKLMQLPGEVILKISDNLPLASRIAFGRQTCSALRSLHKRVSLNPSHRISVVEIQDAIHLIRRRTAMAKGSDRDRRSWQIGEVALWWYPSHMADLAAFIRAVRYFYPQLRAPEYSTDQQEQADPLVRSLFAVGKHGVPGRYLVHMLCLDPVLQHVETVIKTRFHDDKDTWTAANIWTFDDQETSESALQPLMTDYYKMCHKDAHSPERGWTVPSLAHFKTTAIRNELFEHYSTIWESCISSQAIVAVGSKNPPFAVLGQGLRTGYDCMCFVLGRMKQWEEQSLPSARPMKLRPSSLKHVIFVEHTDDRRSAQKLETMFDWSTITCAACKETIEI